MSTNIKELLEQASERQTEYKQYRELYEGEAYKIFGAGDFSYFKSYNAKNPKLKYINYNVFAIISEAFTDLMWNESPKITFKSEENQAWFDEWKDRSSLFTKLYESTLNASIQSESILKLDIRETIPKTKDYDVVVDEIDPSIWYPIYDKTNISKPPQFQCLIFEKQVTKEKKVYLLEKYGYGELVYEAYEYNNGEYVQIDPRIDFLDVLQGQVAKEVTDGQSIQLVIETEATLPLLTHLVNLSSPQEYHGQSDYTDDLLSLGAEINSVLTTISSIIIKHADPMLAVPESAIQQAIQEVKGTNETQNNSTFSNSMSSFVNNSTVDLAVKRAVSEQILNNSKIIGLPADGSQMKPEYITYDSNLDVAFKHLENIIKMIFHRAGVSKIFWDENVNVGALSGIAIKRLSMAMINKAKRKQIYLTQAIKSLVFTAQQLAINTPNLSYKLAGKAEIPTIQWSDGFPDDLLELATTHQALVDLGVENSTDAMQAIYGYDRKTAESKAKEIQDNQINFNTPVLDTNNQATS